MGLIDFVKGAGAKLFGLDDEPEVESQAKEDVDKSRAEALKKAVGKTGIAVDGLAIEVSRDLATVRGSVGTQADREKVVLAVGNTLGIARVNDELQVEQKEPEATFYTVVSGDTLSKIAKTQYGDAMKYPTIFEANKPMLTDPDKIYPGQVLRIPPQQA